MPDPSPQWTPETEDLIDAVINVSGTVPAANKRADLTDSVLTALADAGLLLPLGGETRREWAIRVDLPVPGRKEHPGDIMTHLGEEKSRRCREVWDGWTPLRRTVTTWPDGATFTSPWEVTDGE